ncbi:MAG: tRNA lysidine(34) synthetase TilS [Clostridia bacterium]
MEHILESIKKNKLIEKGDIVAVACSGGSDSMALLHYMSSIQEELDFEVIAINVDHGIRENSFDDSKFVMNYCKEHFIRAYKFKVDAPRLAKEKNISLEVAAREARYAIFDAAIEKGLANKIAVAHHISDQAETILLRLFRGSGISGAKGMDSMREGVYIRPMLGTTKNAIQDYVEKNNIPTVMDETNFDDSYSRNFIRNEIMPLIKKRWPGVEEALVNFGKFCREDDEFIYSQVYDDAMITEGNVAKIPLSYFVYSGAIVTRMIFVALKKIGVSVDIERKHIALIKELAKNGENGSRLNLPMHVTVFKEYDYITFCNKIKTEEKMEWPFKCGEFEVASFGKVITKRVKDYATQEDSLVLDYRKVPKGAIWRMREDGDVFEKFGGGTKKLKSYLIDKKIPLRERNSIPVLAYGNEVYIIAGVEISNKVKIEEKIPTAYRIEIKK